MRKKVLFLSHDASVTGAPVFLSTIIRKIRQEDSFYDVSIFFAKNGKIAVDLINEGFNVYVGQKAAIPGSSFTEKIIVRLQYYFYFIRVILRYKPDLIYSNTIMNFGEVFVARILCIKTILHIHEGFNFASKFKFKLKLSCYFAYKIIVGSDYANKALEKLTGFTGCVVYNGIKLCKPKERHVHTPDRDFRLGTLATIDPNKGQLVALKAIKLLVDSGEKVKLLLAGQSSDEIYLKELNDFISENKLNSQVEILGFVADSENFLRSLDLLIVPSYDEVFPTVILEAFSLGLPVVASNVGGIPEIIINNENSYLFGAGNSIELARSVKKLFNNNIYRLISRNALDTVMKNFSSASMIHRVNSHIDSCLKG